MKTMTAAEANRKFSSLLKDVSRGEEILVVSRGKAGCQGSAIRFVLIRTRISQGSIAVSLTETNPHWPAQLAT